MWLYSVYNKHADDFHRVFDKQGRIIIACGEPAISLHFHHVSLVQWTTRLLPVMRYPDSNPRGVLM
jgi:hypothetical protein